MVYSDLLLSIIYTVVIKYVWKSFSVILSVWYDMIRND